MSSASPLAKAAATTPPNSSSSPLGQAAFQLYAVLARALPYFTSTFLVALDVAKSSWAFSQRFMIHPIPIILYIIAPLTMFVGYLLSIFVFTPYATIVYLLETLHPLYVFCGVACLTGALLGVVGRLVAWGLVAAVAPDPKPELKDKRRRADIAAKNEPPDVKS